MLYNYHFMNEWRPQKTLPTGNSPETKNLIGLLSPSVQEIIKSMIGLRGVTAELKRKSSPPPTLEQMDTAFTQVRAFAYADPLASLWDMYAIMAKFTPYVRKEVHMSLIPALASKNPHELEIARRVTFNLNVGSVLRGAEPYETGVREIDDQLLQVATIGLFEALPVIYRREVIEAGTRASMGTMASAHRARSYIMKEFGFPQAAFSQRGVEQTLQAIDKSFEQHPFGMKEIQLAAELKRLAALLKIPAESLRKHMERRNGLNLHLLPNDDPEETRELWEEVEGAISPGDLEFLMRRFGFGCQSEPSTFRELGEIYGYSHTRAMQVEKRIIGKLKRVLIDEPVPEASGNGIHS